MQSPQNWRKSSYSGDRNNCVEVADWAGISAVRDTQNRDLGMLAFGSAEWRAFLDTTKNNTH